MKVIRILAVLFFLSFGATFLALRFDAGKGESQGNVRVEIRSGQSVREIALALKREGVIRSAVLFQWYLRFKGADRSLRPGMFLFSSEATFAEIARALVQGEGQEVSVTIPEGYTVEQIDALLAQMDLVEAGELLACAGGLSRARLPDGQEAPTLSLPKWRSEVGCDFSRFEFLPSPPSLEGYLFPDTYFVTVQDFNPEGFLTRLLETFRERVVAGLKTDLEVSGTSLHEVITMASLIERETRTSEERPIVAGILWKRFEAGTVLDVDATVRYALSKLTGPLTKADLEVDSPYNTRRHRGLPPSPIANPGLASIMAALHPTDSPYFYYLHDRDGTIHYAITNEEHNLNKAKYL